MKIVFSRRPCFLSGSALVAACLGISCKSVEVEQPASMALRYGTVQNIENVNVKVSLSNQAVYVYEGSEPRFVAAVSIGKPSNPTPQGTFKVQHKEKNKRSSGYGFFVKGDEVIPGKRGDMPPGYRYVGYPLPYWVYFAHDCGFHAGAVWPEPRTHGCLRLHRTIAKDFFDMVKVGTPVHIAQSLPEDATLGQSVPRPTDYDHPDSPPSVRITDAPFNDPNCYF